MLLRDPLVHFLAVGALLFAVFLWRGSDEAQFNEVRIGADRVEQIRRAVSLLEGRELSAAELRASIEPEIQAEVYYREALALGLDVEDDQVRDRLIEKMRYLTENLADPEPASPEDLRAFYEQDPERFLIQEHATFDQVFFSPSQRGEALASDVEDALAALEAGAEPAGYGDRTPLESRLTDAARERVQILFGDELTAAVFSGPANQWLGPFTSDFGQHLIRVIRRADARVPPYEEIVEQVSAVYADDRRRAANEAAYQEIRGHYDVVIEWPADLAGSAAE
jgi:hypothetical protein